MRHKGYKNRGGTTDGALALDLRPGSRIGRNHWHSRKRIQMIMVPKRHDWDSLMLQGAATREVQERHEHKPTKVPINSKKWLEKKEDRVPVESNARRKRSKAAQVGK